jgi:hypothetical protein
MRGGRSLRASTGLSAWLRFPMAWVTQRKLVIVFGGLHGEEGSVKNLWSVLFEIALPLTTSRASVRAWNRERTWFSDVQGPIPRVAIVSRNGG